MFITLLKQNPMINFRKNGFESSKNPNLKSSENPNEMHEFMHENMK